MPIIRTTSKSKAQYSKEHETALAFEKLKGDLMAMGMPRNTAETLARQKLVQAAREQGMPPGTVIHLPPGLGPGFFDWMEEPDPYLRGAPPRSWPEPMPIPEKSVVRGKPSPRRQVKPDALEICNIQEGLTGIRICWGAHEEGAEHEWEEFVPLRSVATVALDEAMD